VENNPEVVPEDWRKAVKKILREGDESCIEWTKQAFSDWRAATLSQFRYEAYEAIASFLSDRQAAGTRINLPEPGEAYAFFFRYQGRVLYGKICLRPANLRIKIISTHTPRKGDKLF
jgi:hypothetical protein